MKKYLLILSIVFSLLILKPINVSATSGACSYHSGVNCSLSNATESIICNDGGNDSSTNYDNLLECRNVKCDVNSVYAFVGNRGMVGSGTGQALVNNCEDFNRNLDNTISSGYVNVPLVSTDDLLKAKMQQFCVEKYGVNSFNNWGNKKCECTSGYIMNPNNSFKCEKEEIVNKAKVEAKNQLDAICVKYAGTGSVWDSSLEEDSGGLRCNPSREQNFNKAFDIIFYKALNDNQDFPKNIDKEAIKKMALTQEYKNTPIADVIRKYAKDNNLLVSVPNTIIGVPRVLPNNSSNLLPTKKEVSNTKPTAEKVITPVPVSLSIPQTTQPIQIIQEPTKKLKWYQVIFSWFK